MRAPCSLFKEIWLMKCKVWLSSLGSTPLDPERNSSSRTMGGYAQVVRRPWLVVEEGGKQLLWQEEGLKIFNGEDYLLISLPMMTVSQRVA